MLEQGNRTFIGSVCFVDIVGYSRQPVSEQILLKDRFTELLSESLKDVAPDQRIILDTGDGAALSFLGDPEDALFVSMNMRDCLSRTAASAASAMTDGAGTNESAPLGDLSLRIGVNLGPVKLIRDINGQPNIVGDGINVAQRIMSFAHPGQIVVSRSYYDVVSVISDEYARLFTYEGSRTDKHVREHEIYIVGESATVFEKVRNGMAVDPASTNTRMQAAANGVSTGTYTSKREDAAPAKAGEGITGLMQDSRKLIMLGALLAAVVLALLFALVIKKPVDKTDSVATVDAMPPVSAKPSPAETANAIPAAPAGQIAVEPATAKPSAPEAQPTAPVENKMAKTEPDKMAKTEPATGDAAKTEAAKLAATQGIVNFSIQPWGTVFVNGKSIGASPPLKQTRLAPGKYKIEIRNTTFPPFVSNVEIKPKEELGIKHKFQ